MQPLDPIWIFIEKLEGSGFKYFVTGSIASIVYGEPRLTHDIDLVLHLETEDISKLEALFPLSDFYCPPEEVIRIENSRRPYGHFNLIHHATGFKADIYLEGNDPLHNWAFLNRKRIAFQEKQSLWIAPPEYLIIRKLEFLREGGSDKHLKDIEGMLPQIQSQLNHQFLNDQIKKRGLIEFWSKTAWRS